MHREKHKPLPLSLFCVICDKEKSGKVTGTLEGHKAYFSLVLHGHGTANSKILGYLGLGQTEKRVFMSVMPAGVARDVLHHMDEVLQFKKPGHGVAFISKIHEGCYHRLVEIPNDDAEGETMQTASGKDLIMVIVNRGYTEEVMEAARSAGATGGTVLHARGCGLQGAEKFFGVTIQPEKEMIMILATDDVSCGIMEEIAHKTGPETDAGAVSFSMPVGSVKGIGNDLENAKAGE